MPVDCELLTDDLLDADARQTAAVTRRRRATRPTLLLENLECMPAAHQSLLLAAIRQNAIDARIIATIDRTSRCPSSRTDERQRDDEAKDDEQRRTIARCCLRRSIPR